MYSKFNESDIVRYTKDGRIYVVCSVDAGSYKDKYIQEYSAEYSIMLQKYYDVVETENRDPNTTMIHNVKENDLVFISKSN